MTGCALVRTKDFEVPTRRFSVCSLAALEESLPAWLFGEILIPASVDILVSMLACRLRLFFCLINVGLLFIPQHVQC